MSTSEPVSRPGYALRLIRDRLDGDRAGLPATNRVLYLLAGALTVDGKNVPANSAWHGAGPCAAVAGPPGRRCCATSSSARTGRCRASRCSRTTSRSIHRSRP